MNEHPNYLIHYGRSIKDGAPGVGTGNWVRDYSLSKDEVIKRLSDTKESEIRKGAYASYREEDYKEYLLNFKDMQLGNTKTDKLYEHHIKPIKDLKIRSGRSTVLDVIKSMRDKQSTEAFKKLDKAGYFDASKNAYERYEMYSKNDDLEKARKYLASHIHDYIYTDRNSFADRYSGKYAIIIDPEDYCWNYQEPLIFIDPNQFEITDVKEK